MMDCAAARQAIDADPRDATRALAEHVAGCSDCAAYALEASSLDARLRRVMEVPVPRRGMHRGPYAVTTTPEVALSRRRPVFATRRLALAASLATATVLAGLLWVGVPRESLARDVVDHMAEEPASWGSRSPVAAETLEHILSRAGIRLRPNAPDVTYAQPCTLRGKLAPHLVVRTLGGPVTVMVLPQEHVQSRSSFDRDGYRGVLVPAPRGALAVLVPHSEAQVDVAAVARTVLESLVYEPA